MRLLLDIATGLWESLRETLPGDEQEAGVFLAGLTWGFVIFWTCLILVTLAYLKTVPGAS